MLEPHHDIAEEPEGAPDPAGDAPFARSLDHLMAELERVDRMVRLGVAQARLVAEEDSLPGLTISEAEIDALLERAPGEPHWTTGPEGPEVIAVKEAIEWQAAVLSRRAAESGRRGVQLRLVALAERFGLTRFDLDVLLLALAPEIDLRYERLFAYLNDDMTRKRPTVNIGLFLLAASFEERLAARRRFAPGAPLVRHGLLRGLDAAARQGSLLAAPLEVEERIIWYLLGSEELDPRLGRAVRLVHPRARLEGLLLPEETKESLLRLAASHRGQTWPVVTLKGPESVGKTSLVEALCGEIGVPVLVVDLEALLAEGDAPFRAALPLVAREARLWSAALCWDGSGALGAADRKALELAVAAAIAEHDGPVFLLERAPWAPAGALGGRPLLRLEIPRPRMAEQAALWNAALRAGDAPAMAIDVAALTSRFRLTGGQIHGAVAAARALCLTRGQGAVMSTADVLQACRLRYGGKQSFLARKVPLVHRWDDVVLREDRRELLRAICRFMQQRNQVFVAWGFDDKLSLGKGLSALFSGPPGTGKTMAAAVIASELELDLYQIDLSQVVSKYIGETEKHLGELFDEAEATSAILFFDEADALFGKRTEVRDAHDRYANVETSYLLQRIDAHEGVVILATNLLKNMDEAFMRRLSFIVDFPFPSPKERAAIWKRAFPAETPLDPDVDFERLGARLELAGGSIRNVALAAAMLAAEQAAAVGMWHLFRAARLEFQKMGKVVKDETFG